MNQANLKNILSARFDFNVWKDLLEKIFPKVEIFTSFAKISDPYVKDGGHVGNIRLDDGRSLAIFDFEVVDNVLIQRNRRTLRNIAANFIDQDKFHGALAFYHSQSKDDYRLTFIAKQTYFNESGELVRKETSPKRYTFLLGPNEPCATATSRLFVLANKKIGGFMYLADVIEAFSVERLNKEFFEEYKKQYNIFLEKIGNTKRHRDYVKKLLGRLVFLQFLQKKGWMGVPESDTNWEGGDKKFLVNLVKRHVNNERLLSDVFEPLFFGILNTKPEDRETLFIDKKWDMQLLEEFNGIPYLNGGLFEPDSIDDQHIDFPYDFFKHLMEFFSQYNFTIDENDPDDSEIGIDPEMLGHIFENLLEDNKDKGAFYTPKEIVQYMCENSIGQYLKTHLGNTFEPSINNLLRAKFVDEIVKDNAKQIYELLCKVRVCDPAIGSGAFPMGILNILFQTRQLLYPYAKYKESFSLAGIKRDIIQNNIFGVDIEQGAVDIARLRFWLALVVDEEVPQPLPNLDYKIMCGNSQLYRYALKTPISEVFKEYNKAGRAEARRKKTEWEDFTLESYKQLVTDYLEAHDNKSALREKIDEI